jgi:hypothetical protein
MYQLVLLTFLVTNGKLEIQQNKIDIFYTASECERFKVVLEKNTLISYNQILPMPPLYLNVGGRYEKELERFC